MSLLEGENHFVNDVTFDFNSNIIINTSDGRFIVAVHDSCSWNRKEVVLRNIHSLPTTEATEESNVAYSSSPIQVSMTEAVSSSLTKNMKLPRLYVLLSNNEKEFTQSILNGTTEDTQVRKEEHLVVKRKTVSFSATICTLTGIKDGFLAINRVARVVIRHPSTGNNPEKWSEGSTACEKNKETKWKQIQDEILIWTPKGSCCRGINQEIVTAAPYPGGSKVVLEVWDGSLYCLNISCLEQEGSKDASHESNPEVQTEPKETEEMSSHSTSKLLLSSLDFPCIPSSSSSSSPSDPSLPLRLHPMRDALGVAIKFPQLCSYIGVYVSSSHPLYDFVFGLSSRSYSLYRNNALLVKGCCTSFLLHDNSFLVYTTTCHQIEWHHPLSDQMDLLSGTPVSLVHPMSTLVSSSSSNTFGEEEKRGGGATGNNNKSISGDAVMASVVATPTLSSSSCSGCRPIERGSKVIVSIPSTGAVILQARRGNLETVYPRSFLWVSVVSLIHEHNDFLTAFEVMKKHRMNFNLLVDHDPDMFISSLETFIDQLSSEPVKHQTGNGMKSTFGGMDNLVLFLTSLSDEVYSSSSLLREESKQTMQTGITSSQVASTSAWTTKLDKSNQERSYWGSSTSTSCLSRKGKVFTICTKMRDLMIKRMTKPGDSNNCDQEKEHRFLHPILLSLIKCRQIDEALMIIKNLNEESVRSQALSFLLYFIEVGDLFNHALGTYDFDIVLMVASKSSKDPKEYSKLLHDFSVIIPESYRRYSIDLYLKRYEKALENLSQCHGQMTGGTKEERDDKEKSILQESLKLIQEKRLFHHAIQVYSKSSHPNTCQEIWQRYGDYLLSKKYYKEAAIAFENATVIPSTSMSTSCHSMQSSSFSSSSSSAQSEQSNLSLCLEKGIKAHSLAGDFNQALKLGLRLYSPLSVFTGGGEGVVIHAIESGEKKKCVGEVTGESDQQSILQPNQTTGEVKFKLLCLSLIESLKSSGKHSEAGFIALSYLPVSQTEKLDKAIEISIEGHEWDQTVRLLQHKKQLQELLEETNPSLLLHNQVGDEHYSGDGSRQSDVDEIQGKQRKTTSTTTTSSVTGRQKVSSLSWQNLYHSFMKGLEQHAINCLSLISSESQSLLESHVPRLLHLRHLKRTQEEDQRRHQTRRFSEDEEFFDDSSSQVSSLSGRQSNYSSHSKASTRLSLRTRASTTATDSSLSSKKRDIKKWSKLKTGSRFEDVALVIVIKESIVRLDSSKEEVSLLLKHLFCQGKVDEAKKLRSSFKTLLSTVIETDLINKVWIPNLKESFYLNDVDENPDFGKNTNCFLTSFFIASVVLFVTVMSCVNISKDFTIYTTFVYCCGYIFHTACFLILYGIPFV